MKTYMVGKMICGCFGAIDPEVSVFSKNRITSLGLTAVPLLLADGKHLVRCAAHAKGKPGRKRATPL